MKNHKLAWRNLWRNKRRTLITASSIFFAVFFALFMRSLQLGSYDYMYKNVIESYSGYLQIQQAEWWDEKTIDNSFYYSEALKHQTLEDENVIEVIPRIESFALASSGNNTNGVMVMGIDPDKENLLSDIGRKLVKYKLYPELVNAIQDEDIFSDKIKENAKLFEGAYYYQAERLMLDLQVGEDASEIRNLLIKRAAYKNNGIQLSEPGVWLGDKLADYLNLQTGDTLVLLGQGYHGATAAGKFEIKGLIKLPVPDISSKIVYMPYDIAQDLYGAEGNLTSLVLNLKDNSDKAIEKTMQRLSEKHATGTRIIEWREMNETIIQQMEADNVSGMFMIAILYLVIGFGIFGTILMMTAERKREFGVLVAIGMQKKKLASVMTWELLYIGLLGIGMGIMITLPIILYGVEHPIIFKGELAHMMEEYDFEPKLAFQAPGAYFLWQMFIVGLMVLLSLIHPLKKIRKMIVVNALRA